VEVGTVTRQPQPGNPRPRLFRLRASAAIVNRMGFNNAGAEALAARLARLGPLRVPLGISLGKSRVVPNEAALDDYVASLRALRGHGDYFAVNVSSPNTPGLRALQDRAFLSELLAALAAETDRPLLVKVAPDLTEAALGEVLEVAAEHRIAGIIATNTTVSRAGVAAPDAAVAGREAGGLSGPPLHQRVIEVVKFVTSESDLPVVGSAGLTRPRLPGAWSTPGPASSSCTPGSSTGGRRSCGPPSRNCGRADGPPVRGAAAGRHGRARAAVRGHRPASRAARGVGSARRRGRPEAVRRTGDRGASR
jgi:hypothetical protein